MSNANPLQLLRSNTANKRPDPTALADGRPAINTNAVSPGLFFKDSAGNLVKVGPVHVGTTAPNASPASGGATGNSLGEQWLDTTGGVYVLKIWDGSTWRSETGTFVDASGDTMTGALVMDNQQQVRFREVTANGTNYIALQAPASVASDKTITLPDVNGTVVTTGDTGTVTSTMILDGTIVNADVNASAAIAGTKISPDFGSQNVTTTGTNTAASFIPTSSTVPANGVYLPAANSVAISTNSAGRIHIGSTGTVNIVGAGSAGSTQAVSFNGSAPVNSLVIDSSGRVGIGTSSPGFKLTIEDSTTPRIRIGDGVRHLNVDGGSASQNAAIGTDYAGSFGIYTNGAANTRFHITSAGLVGIGTTGPTAQLSIQESTAPTIDFYTGAIKRAIIKSTNAIFNFEALTGNDITFTTNSNERARLDASGRLLVGTSSSPSAGLGQYALAVVQGYAGSTTGEGILSIARGKAATALVNTDTVGQIAFTDNAGNTFAKIVSFVDGTVSSTSDLPGALSFSTTADGASSPTERMRIINNGAVLIGNTTQFSITSNTATGSVFGSDGTQVTFASAQPAAYFGRQTNDGTIVEFRQDGSVEGSISVSGTTVSYNGAHLSRWSQLLSGAERTEILRGTVLSNIDEMCEWGDEENEQLNRMKVSDVEGDKNVAGVFQAWDDDDDTYTNDFYCAMTGDFIIRIGAGVTVERGDLLMSAGDGTAKPQDDDIIRSKTVAKVTSTNVSCTYDDGSYCVPCVLMAC